MQNKVCMEVLNQKSLYDLSKKMEEIFNFNNYWIELPSQIPANTPLALNLNLHILSKKLTVNLESYRNRFYDGVLSESLYGVPKKAKVGYEQTLESVTNEIKMVANYLTNYKVDYLKLVNAGFSHINEQERFINYLEELENAIVHSYINLPEYKQQEQAAQHTIIKEKELLGFVYLKTLKTLPKEEMMAQDFVPNPLPKINPVPPANIVTSFSSHAAINEVSVDLEEYPYSHGMPLTSTDCLVLGDLHGNALKLINFLLRENIMTGISKKDYDELVALYKSSSENNCTLDKDLPSSVQLVRKKLSRFNEIIAQLIPVNKNAIPSIMLIGDVLADRGDNDYYTLRILAQLNSQNIFPKILLSNHDREFLNIYEKGFDNFDSSLAWKAPYDCDLYSDQSNSLMQLGRLIQIGAISKEEVTFLVETAYLPLLSGIELNVNFEQKELTVFTHAPVPLTIIPALAKQLDIPIEEATLFQSPIKIIEVVDSINTKLKQLLKDKAFFKCAAKGTALYNLMWERTYMPQFDRRNSPVLPAEWSTVHVHGHDGIGRNTRKISDKISTYDLDNDLGKSVDKNKGVYNIFYCGNNIHFNAERTKYLAQAPASFSGNSFFPGVKTNPESKSDPYTSLQPK